MHKFQTINNSKFNLELATIENFL